MKKKILLVQLGSPRSLKIRDVRSYLREFLLDPRVVDLPRFLWVPILYLFVLPFRPFTTRKLYKNIALPDGTFPLVDLTEKLKNKLRLNLKDRPEVEIETAYVLGVRTIAQVLPQFIAGDKEAELIIVPLFPQYSESTSASVFDVCAKVLARVPVLPKIRFVREFWNLKSFIDLSAAKIKAVQEEQRFDKIILSFHGLPKRRVLEKKDPYYEQCYRTYHLIRQKLSPELQRNLHISFQSRFGSEEWLTPSTEEMALRLAGLGNKKIGVYCPSFTTDCLETLEEIAISLDHKVRPLGSSIGLIPCLNDDENWALGFSEWMIHLADEHDPETKNKKNDAYFYASHLEVRVPEVKLKSTPLPAESKKTLKLVFLTLFLDLVGFSMIFPLFPALARHYLEVDAANPFLLWIFKAMTFFSNGNVSSWENFKPALDAQSLVLFGGILGAYYSFLQFVASPFWGSLSDRIGRRPVLIVSIGGMVLSYVLWFFSGSFTTLLVARLLGGMMAGNMSTATAVAADITDTNNRSKGMAVVGIAFALGFIFGPAIGGISALWDFTKIFPDLVAYGINPFSSAALVAFVFSLVNFVLILKYFPETNPPAQRQISKNLHQRSINPFKLFTPLPYAGTNLTNFGYFLFLAAFSGMEFTLTFLALERLSFTSMQNASMFIFVGVVITLVQGGFVRRKAHQIGEKRMVVAGMLIVIPGLVILGFMSTPWMLYFGLAFLSVGSAMIIPCLTALASLYAPAHEQGRVLGVFRSLGALARVVGPFLASLIYWHYGSLVPYLLGAVILLLPAFMISLLPGTPEIKMQEEVVVS